MTFAELFARIKALRPDGHVCLTLSANRYSSNFQQLEWAVWVGADEKRYQAETPEALLDVLNGNRTIEQQLEQAGEVVL